MHYYSLLLGNEKIIYETIKEGLLSIKEKIKLPVNGNTIKAKSTQSIINKCIEYVLYDFPEIFYKSLQTS